MLRFDAHFKDLFENTSDLIQFLDKDANIEVVNTSWLKAMGYSREEVTGRPIYDFIHPEQCEIYRKTRENGLASSSYDYYTEAYFRKKDGSTLIIEGHVRKITTAEGLLYTRGVFRDITKRKAEENQVKETQNRLKKFFEFAPNAVIVIDEQQRVTEWNLKAEAIFGYTAEEAKGRLLSETIVPPRFTKAHQAGISHFLTTGEGPVLNKTIEMSAVKKDGTEFPISLSISNVKMGDEWMFVAFISDVTERRRQEEELRLKNESLLQIARIQSHEVRGPVASIMGLMNVIKQNGYQIEQEPLLLMEEALHTLDEKIRTIVAHTYE